MDILARKIAGAYDSKLAAPAGAPWTEVVQSPYSVSETIARLVNVIEAQGNKVFATISHGEEAKKAGQMLNETEVLLIGNPSKGTALMQAKPAIAIDLPLRIMVWKDDKGEVWVSFTDPVSLGKMYNVSGQDAILKQMRNGLLKAIRKATQS